MNQLIHSWAWLPSIEPPAGFRGIYVSSDFDRRKGAYFFSVDVLTEVFRRVARDDVIRAEFRRDDRGEMRPTMLSSIPSPRG